MFIAVYIVSEKNPFQMYDVLNVTVQFKFTVTNIFKQDMVPPHRFENIMSSKMALVDRLLAYQPRSVKLEDQPTRGVRL